MDPSVEPLAPDVIRSRRDQRLLLVLRAVIPLSAVGVISASPILFLEGIQRTIAVQNEALLVGLFCAYLATYRTARAGRFDRARAMLFTSWISYLGAQLLLFRPDGSLPMAEMVVVGICTSFVALVLMGVVALDTWHGARRWLFAVLFVYVTTSLFGIRHLETHRQIWIWVTTFGVSWLLLGASSLFAWAFASDLYASLSQSELALRAANEANAAKSAFLANMSHELRTPLTGILGFVELLREEAQEEGRADLDRDLEKIWRAADHLHGVIGDVLDLSKIEAGKLVVEPRRTDLHALLDQVIATSRPMANKRGNALDLVVADVPAELWIDGGRLRQVLLNLLSNAIKFTENGRVKLSVRGAEGGLRFEVADTGIGIPPDKLELVFEPFEQADGSTTRRYGGTGLGLAISRRLVALFEGQLSVHSELGRGTTFWFVLPVREAPANVTPPS